MDPNIEGMKAQRAAANAERPAHPVGKMRVGEIVTREAHGATMTIYRSNARNYNMRATGDGERCRWGSNLADVNADLWHFEQTGHLPRAKGPSWA